MGKNTIQKVCQNCSEWDGTIANKINECLNIGAETKYNKTCDKFNADPFRFCPICNSDANEGEHSSLVCLNNDHHYASQWDLIWHEY